MRKTMLGATMVALLGVTLTGLAGPAGAEKITCGGDYQPRLVQCAMTAWDPESDVDCLPSTYDEDSSTGTSACGTDDAYGARSSGGPQCGYGWAQAWAVKVELSTGNARVRGHIDCDSHEKASCIIQIDGVKVCEDDGGSEKGPLVCGYTIEEIAAHPVKGIVKCTDPANPSAIVTVGFEILSELTGPVSYP